eukprot:665630-Alexandrium_andersonii.AAC.1
MVRASYMSTRHQRPPGRTRARRSCSRNLRCLVALGTCVSSACGLGHCAVAPGGRACEARIREAWKQ